MNRYSARFTVTRTRTIVETAVVDRIVDAHSFGSAVLQVEDSVVSFGDSDFDVISETSEEGSQVLTCIERVFQGPEVSVDGLTPAHYESSPSPSGGDYFPVQVEPTPIV